MILSGRIWHKLMAYLSSAMPENIPPNQGPDGDSEKQERKIIIRKARRLDRTFVISLGSQLFSIYGPYERAVSQWFDHETTTTFIAELNRTRVGFIMLGSFNQGWETPLSFELLALGLCPASRRKGIGDRLMQTMENHAVQQGLDRVFLHTAVINHSAQKLFYKRGYRPYGLEPQFYPAGQDALVMSKKLRRPDLKESLDFET